MRAKKITLLTLIIFFVFLATPPAILGGSGCESRVCDSIYSRKYCHTYACDPDWCDGLTHCTYCICSVCECVGCEGFWCWCCPCTSPPCAGCFTGETGIGMSNQESAPESGQARTKNQKSGIEQIKELEPGKIVSSFDPETGEIKENTVSGILKFPREGYYELETESGKKVKVTGEHPFLAVKAENSILNTENLKLIDNLKNIISNTLTYKLITNLRAKVNEVLR
jgi:hypothetical protein